MCVFVALVIQHAMRMHRIIMSSVAYLPQQYFSTLSHKCCDFLKKKKKVFQFKMCFNITYTLLSETFLILRRIQGDIIINAHRSSCNVQIIPVRA